MKFLLLGTAALTLALVSASPELQVRVHLDKGNDDICYKACNPGEYCVRGSDKCSKPPQGQCFNPATSRWIAKCDPGFTCRNGKCEYTKKAHKKVELYDDEDDDDDTEDTEDTEDDAKKVVKKAKKAATKGGDAICYKACNPGEYCVRGSDKCSKPPQGQCFNPATSRWIAKCDPGFTCRNGKCEYTKKSHKKVELYDDEDDDDNEDDDTDEESKVVVKKAKKASKGADDICYKWCPNGQYCARGQTTCRGAQNDCFNPATSRWIANCDPGFKCKNGKCDYAHHLGKKSLIKGPNDICYKQCPSGKYCVIGDTECRTPPSNKCFNPAKSVWIDKCDPGFECKNGKCDYARKAVKAVLNINLE